LKAVPDPNSRGPWFLKLRPGIIFGGFPLSKELSISISSGGASHPATWVRSTGIVLAGSVLLAVCSHIALPLFFTPVPLTLQTFAVLVLGLLFSPGLAAGTAVAYLAEGALGLPVFASTPALPGIAHLLGPTGGYLISYPVAAALTSFLWRRIGRGTVGAGIAATAGSVVILACGTLWLGSITGAGLEMTLASAVFPFVPGELLKITAAALVASGLRRFRTNNS
jgi:biotin transport system substrate-specific component